MKTFMPPQETVHLDEPIYLSVIRDLGIPDLYGDRGGGDVVPGELVRADEQEIVLFAPLEAPLTEDGEDAR